MVIWLAILVVAIVCIPLFLAGALSPELKVTGDPESQRARDEIRANFASSDTVDEIVIVRGADKDAVVAKLSGEIKGTEGVRGVANGPTSQDGDAALLFVDLAPDQEKFGDTIDHIVEVVADANRGGTNAFITGQASTGVDLAKLSEHDLRTGELAFGLPAAMIILCLVFGALVAAALPMMLALVSIVIALALLGAIGNGYTFSIFAVNMISGMGLALGIDYSLFVLSRFRE